MGGAADGRLILREEGSRVVRKGVAG